MPFLKIHLIIAGGLDLGKDIQLNYSLYSVIVENINEADRLLHSDCGVQYTSKEYLRSTSRYGVTRHRSQVGKCIDNVPMESFWSHFKTRCYYWIKCETYCRTCSGDQKLYQVLQSPALSNQTKQPDPEEYRNQAA